MISARRALLAAAAFACAACSSTGVVTTQLTISADPPALDFGSQAAGSQVSKAVTLHNTSLGSISISSASIVNDTRHAFTLSATPTVLSASSSATIQVTYAAPAAEGPDGATLDIASDADNASVLLISLSGHSLPGCAAESDAAFCARLGKNCGPVSALDSCGASRTVAGCGSCTSPQVCTGAVANVCSTPQFSVSVTLAGTGTGSVRSSPPGISCGATCSASFESGSSVILTAAPSGGSSFGGFTGGCSGQTCVLDVGAPVSVTATFNAPAAAKLAFKTQPSDARSSAAISPSATVAVEDASGNVIAGSSATVTLAVSSGPLSGTTSVAAVNGLATFDDLSIALAGTYTLSASSSGLTPATSNSFNITAGDASQLAFSQQPASTTASTTLAPPITVLIEDSAGNLTNSTAPVALASTPATSLAGTATVAAVSGVATFSDLSIAAAGTYSLAATSAGLTSATSDSFTISANKHTLSITVVGSGSISSSPAGISACTSSSGTCSAAFTDDNAIVLTATPAGTVLAGWSGAGCSGASTCSITLSGAGASTTATFAPTHLNTARAEHRAVLLPSGKVLLVGGRGAGGVSLNDAELYDPATGAFTVAGTMPHSLYLASATLLGDGRVLIAGGWQAGDYASGSSSDTWLYSEAAGFVAGPALPAGRAAHGAVLLESGQVILMAGITNGSPSPCAYPTDSQLFDAAGSSGAGTWTASGSIHLDRASVVATLVAGGKVLITGGPQDNCPTPNYGDSEAELYDPAGGIWIVTGSMNTSRTQLDLVTLSGGDGLVVGGNNNTGALPSAERFLLGAGGAFTSAGSLTTARYSDAAAVLQSGRVAVVGGTSTGADYLTSVEVYDPTAGTWGPGTTPLVTGRYSHTATVLASGKVLATGGYGSSGASPIVLDSAEMLDEGGAAAAIATTAAGPQLIVANSSNLYFTTNSEIYSLPVAGGTPSPFAPIAGGNGDSGAYGMALDSTNLYFTDYGLGALKKVLLASPFTVTTIASFSYASYYAQPVAVAGGNVYWGGYASGQVEETPTAGSNITSLFDAGSTYNSIHLTTDATNLYWSSSPNTGYNPANHGAIYQLPLTATSSAGTVTLASGLGGPSSIATTSGYVFWTDLDNSVKSAPIGGTTVATVAPSEAGASNVVADSTSIYWIDVLSAVSPHSSKVRTCTISAGTCGPITTLATISDVITSIAVSGSSLYWVGYYNAQIWKSAK